MLPKHPNIQRDEPATSPALARRRDHMLHGDRSELREPRLIPLARDDDPAPDRDSFADDDFDPEIPPPPIAAPSSEDVDETPEHGSGRFRLLPIAAGALGLIALGGVGWVVYDLIVADVGGGDVPYITAEAGPEKIRPQEEGGMEVPNQDIRVYNELSGSPETPEAEVLLPPPEAPVSPPVAAERHSTAQPVESPDVAAPSPDLEPAAGAGEDPEGTATLDGIDEPAAAAAEPVPEGEPVPEEEPGQTAAAGGAFRIQLAAVKSEDAAQVGWKKMTKSHPDILGGLTPNVVKVDRAGGALYRLQAGPFADRAAAEAACGKLKRKRQDCLVVGP